MRQRSTCPAAISYSGSLRPLITSTLPFAPAVPIEERRLRDVAVAIELHVVEHEQAIRVERRLVGAEDDERAVEPALDLHRLVRVRVVPERARVGQREAVVEASRQAATSRCTSWVPSIGAGRRSPCQWMLVGSGRLFTRCATSVSPTWATIVGPGTEPS